MNYCLPVCQVVPEGCYELLISLLLLSPLSFSPSIYWSTDFDIFDRLRCALHSCTYMRLD